MPLWLPSDFRRAILQPIRERHIAVRQIEGVVSPELRGHRVLLRQHQSHDLAQLDVVEEELDVNGVGWVLGRSIGFVVNEVVLGDHLYIGIFNVDGYRTPKRDGDRTISSEQSPPDSFPQSLVRLAELGTFDAVKKG